MSAVVHRTQKEILEGEGLKKREKGGERRARLAVVNAKYDPVLFAQ